MLRSVRGTVLRPTTRWWLVAGGAVVIAGCMAYRWRPLPITELSLEEEGLVPREVLVETDAGPVGMRVRALSFPYILGNARESGGVAEVDLTDVTSFQVVTLNPQNRVTDGRSMTTEQVRADPGSLMGLHVNARGVVLRSVSRVDYPWVEGTLVGGTGLIRVDLRRATALSVREVDGPGTVLQSLGLAVATVGAVALLVALTKESCPFVYVDRGNGWEFVGEAYAGAAFRSTQRDDLLPIPTLGDATTVRIRLRNEARETQYTDEAALVIVDHARDVRALSSFDGQVLYVGESVAPVAARTRRGEDATSLVAEADLQLWETDAGEAAEMSDAQLEDGLLAEFEAPGTGRLVLEVVGGNTTWLDLVFGRFFAAMGPRLAEYLEQGNEASAGPGIQRWREREGVDLSVEVRAGERWRKIASVPTVGPAALREIAVPLPEDAVGASGRVEVRLRGGMGFWRIDRLGLSARMATAGEPRRLAPRSALTGGRDQLHTILTADGSYNGLSEMNESLELEFDVPPLEQGLARTAFLFSNGYYNVHPPIQSEWSPGNLVVIRDETGGLSRFGRDLAREYADKLAATPVVAVGSAR